MLALSLLLSSLLAGSAVAAPSLQRRAPHVVNVGFEGNLVFNPPAIFAEVGDVVQFVFNAKNHSVVQSSLASPCSPIPNGFNSGFNPVPADTAKEEFPVVEYTVHTPKDHPLWFYCSQAIHTPNAHCAKGMVFSINCGPDGAENSLEKFIEMAKADPAATAPVTTAPTASATNVIVPLLPETSYSGIEIPAITPAVTKTETVTLGDKQWVTTYESYPNSPDPTPSAEDGSELEVLVGKDGALTFEPAFLIAKPRDTIVFKFQSKNHSVAQSSFASPCQPFFTAQGVPGINSGFFPVTAGQATPEFRVKVNDTTPLYFYCGQTGHCGKGMVFAVNTDEKGARSSAAFQTLAKAINGTGAETPSNGNSTGPGTPGDGAVAVGAGAGSLALATVIAAVATFLL